MRNLKRGEKLFLSELTSSLQLRVALGTAPGLKFDFCCFGLGDNGQLFDERYFLFYNRKATPHREIETAGERAGQAMTFAVDLQRLTAVCRRVVFTMVVKGEGHIGQLSGGQVSFLSEGVERARLNFTGSDFGAGKSVIVAELYLHQGAWRVNAVGQGFHGGLDALLLFFGGEVSRPTPSSPSKIPSAPASKVAASNVPAPPPARNPNVCVRCGKTAGFLGQVFGVNAMNRTTQRCKQCEEELARNIENARQQLRADFQRAWESGALNTAQWTASWARFQTINTGMSHEQALTFLRPDSLQFMERLVAMATSNGMVTNTEEAYIRQMSQFLHLSPSESAPFFARLEEVKQISRIREGHLPQVESGDNHLDAGEICHLMTQATYLKVNARSQTAISGRLMATNKKLVFLSATGGASIQYKNIMTAQSDANSVTLELTTRSGNGRYLLSNAERCEAIITALTRMAKRQLLTPQSDNPTRHISQEVKNAVWHRDGGRCVQCHADSYLEFDHIIPFSKGGANTQGNVQLLCRKCNGEKGNRI